MLRLLLFRGALYLSNAQIAKFEVLYIYNIWRYVEWPSIFVSNEFVIGVVGKNNALMEQMKKYAANKTIQNRKVKILNINSPSEINPCHILFFSEGTEDQISTYLIRGRRVLFLSESTKGLGSGADINFFMNEGKLKFELSKTNSIKKDFNISGELEQLATNVE